MKKTKNIFNYMLNDPENIDEKTIYENTGVNADNVKELVMNNIHGKSSAKKNGKKKITFTLIAVAAAVAVLGTTAAATGTFNPVFGQLFAGEAPNGAYTGGNVKINSDTLDINFEGVVGDTSKAYSMMTITKKDGSPIVNDSKNIMIVKTADAFEEYDSTVSISHSLLEDVFGGKRELKDVLYYSFEDDCTLKATVGISDSRNLIGSTMNINESALIVWRVDEVVRNKDELSKMYQDYRDGKYEDEYLDVIGRVKKEYEEKIGHPIAQNQEIMPAFDENGYILDDDWRFHTIVLAHYEKIDFKYDLSVKLNYKDTSVSFDDMIGREITVDGQKQNITEFNVKPFSMSIKTQFQNSNLKFFEEEEEDLTDEEIARKNAEDYEEYMNSDFYKLCINLDNGKTYYAIMPSGGFSLISGTEDMFEGEISYSDFRDDNGNMAIINPSKIVSITYKDKILYSK